MRKIVHAGAFAAVLLLTDCAGFDFLGKLPEVADGERQETPTQYSPPTTPSVVAQNDVQAPEVRPEPRRQESKKGDRRRAPSKHVVRKPGSVTPAADPADPVEPRTTTTITPQTSAPQPSTWWPHREPLPPVPTETTEPPADPEPAPVVRQAVPPPPEPPKPTPSIWRRIYEKWKAL